MIMDRPSACPCPVVHRTLMTRVLRPGHKFGTCSDSTAIEVPLEGFSDFLEFVPIGTPQAGAKSYQHARGCPEASMEPIEKNYILQFVHFDTSCMGSGLSTQVMSANVRID